MRWTLLNSIAFLLLSVCTNAQLLTPEQLDTCRVFRDLNRAIQTPDEVYRLDLSKTKLKDFPKEIFLFRNLQELRLDRNKIKAFPERIGELRFLQILSAEKNKLEEFNMAICRLKHLRELNLANNEIARIPDEVGALASLEKLVLWSNVIGYYPESLSELTKLKELDLLNIQMNEEEQARVRELLPAAKISFSPPCDCEFQDPWDPDFEEEE